MMGASLNSAIRSPNLPAPAFRDLITTTQRSPMKSSSAILSRLVQLLMLTCVLAAGAQAQKIKVEYNKNLDFSKFKTYAWGQHDAVSRPCWP